MGRFGVPVTGDRTIIQNSRGPLRDGLATKDGMPVLPNGFQAAILLVVVALAVRCQISMLNYGFWQDEFETMVASKMMGAGLRLYTDIFNQHGPLIFAFGSALEAITDATIADYRIVIAVLQWLMIGALLLSSAQMPSPSRLLGLTIVVVLMVVALPYVFGQMFLYQTVAGLFAAAAIALLVLPVLQGKQDISTAQAVVGGFLLCCLPFFAFTYAVASAGLILCSLTRPTWRAVMAGVALGAILNAAFIIARCSTSGFIVEHFYLNLAIYPAFGNNNFAETWLMQRNSFLLAAAIGVVLILATAGRLVLRRRGVRWRAAVFVLALLSLLGRGPGFQGIQFYYALLPLVLAATPWVPLTNTARRCASLGVIFACLVKLSLLLPSDARRIEVGQIPTRSAFSDLVKRYTEPSDRIISYSFDNFEYILSQRLPAVADFYFLPQQAVYNARPMLGILSDPCKDIRVSRPKFVKLDKWLAWGRFSWESYGSCIDSIMQDSYGHVKGTPIYIRNDLWPSAGRVMLSPQSGIPP